MRPSLPALLAAWIALTSPGWGLPVNAGTDSEVRLEQPEERRLFSAAIIGDRTGGTEADLAILARAVDEVNRLRPDLVIHIGDMVNGYTWNPDLWMRQMRDVREVIERLEAPFFPVTGNHDTFPGTFDSGDRTNEELYKRHFGPLYYSFDYANSHFVCLYSDEARTSRPVYSPEQLAWLERDLAGCDRENIFVFSHKPSWEYRGGIWDPIHEILRQYPVRAVFGGHFHAYQKCAARDGIQYYVMGATGGFIHKPEVGGGLQHIALLSVEGEEFTVALLGVGSVLPDDYVIAEDYRKFSLLDPLYNRGTGVVGAVPDPAAGAVDAEVPVRVENPLSEPVKAALGTSRECAPWASVPETTVIEVPAGEAVTKNVRLRSPRIEGADFVVPEILITYLFLDSKGRTVPIEVRSRVPTGRSVVVEKAEAGVAVDGDPSEAAWRKAPALPLRFWKYSMYDVEADAPPEVRLLFDGEFFYLAATVADDHPALHPDPPDEPVLSDSVEISVSSPGGEAREFLFRALDDEGGRLYRKTPGIPRWREVVAEGNEFEVETDRTESGYRLEAKVAAAVLFGDSAPRPEMLRFNLSIIDNDFNPYPMEHRWAPKESGHWGTLVIGK